MSIQTAPNLVHLADFIVLVGEPTSVGETGVGVRRVVPINGGSVQGERLRGRILPGGADFQILRPHGLTDIHARYLMETEDGELIYIENSGIRTGSPEVIARLSRGESVDPSQVYFRTTPRFETASEKWRCLQRSIFIASGQRLPDRVELSVFEVR
jgi:hypothetical protein